MTDQKEQDKFVCNLETQCKHCGAKKGFLYNGDVSSPHSSEAKAIEAENDSQSTLDNLPLEPINDEEEPEEIVEESFDKLVNQYLNKIYENVNTYKTTSVSQTSKNSYLFEGVLSFNDSDKQINTSFLLERVKTPSKKYLFKGGNSQLIESAKPFRFIANVKDKALYFENLRYRYTEKIDNDSYLVEGIEKN